MKAVILARVSTSTQEYDRQIQELSDYANKVGLDVVKIFANKVSGAKKNEERTEIKELVEYVKRNKVDKVLVLEISRLGRNTLEALKVIELLNEEKICLFVKNHAIETINENGDVNPMAQFLITILLEVARMERSTIRERMKSGYDNHIKNGGTVGRKKGYTKDSATLKQEYAEEIRLIKKGISLRNISKITGRSVNTIRKVKTLI